MSTSRQRMCPSRERRKPMSARSRVVLPAPFRPIITTRSAAPTRSETPFSTGTCPYRAWRPSTSSTRPLPAAPPVALAVDEHPPGAGRAGAAAGGGGDPAGERGGGGPRAGWGGGPGVLAHRQAIEDAPHLKLDPDKRKTTRQTSNHTV